jgi:hypothetical protein
MSTWVGMGPVIGPGSLDGFAIGVMMSGAVFMAVTAQRRTRGRPAIAAGGTGMLTAGPRDWLRRPRQLGVPRISRAPRVSEIPRLSGASGAPEVSGAKTFDADALEPGAFEAGAFGPSPFGAGPFAAGAERLARPEEPEAYSDTGWHLRDAEWAAAVGDDGQVAGGHRSRHRLNDPLPGTKSPDRAPRGGTTRGGTSRDSGPRGRAVPGARRPSGGFPDSAFPESAFPETASPSSAFPETGFPDAWSSDDPPLDAEWLEPLPDMTPRDAEGSERLSDRAPVDRGRLEPAFPDWASRDEPFPNGASRERGRPDVEFPDVAFPDGTFGTSKRPEPRRLPRHAAPAVGLGAKVGHWMNGLFARPAASGARG